MQKFKFSELAFARATLIGAIAWAGVTAPSLADEVLGAKQAESAEQAQQGEVNDALTAAAASQSRVAIVLPVAALASPVVAEAISPIAVDPKTKVALEGYDPVGYHKDDKAVPGSPEITLEHRGAIFFFVSEENRAAFLSNPEKFVPAHGGYCTETLAMGALTPASPVHWTVHGDRLFLTRSAGANEEFRRHRDESIKTASTQYAAVEAFTDKYNFSATQAQ